MVQPVQVRGVVNATYWTAMPTRQQGHQFIHSLQRVQTVQLLLQSGYKKTREPLLTNDSLLGGGYLRLPASLTIVVVTLKALCQERDEMAG